MRPTLTRATVRETETAMRYLASDAFWTDDLLVALNVSCFAGIVQS